MKSLIAARVFFFLFANGWKPLLFLTALFSALNYLWRPIHPLLFLWPIILVLVLFLLTVLFTMIGTKRIIKEFEKKEGVELTTGEIFEFAKTIGKFIGGDFNENE